MQDQLVKKLKESLNKSTEGYQHISNQSQGGMNNLSQNFNSNFNQTNINAESDNQITSADNYMSNMLKKISQGQSGSEVNRQKAEKSNSGKGNPSDSSNLNLTNKLTQSLKDYYNENGSLAQDDSASIDFITKHQQKQANQKSVIQGDYSVVVEQNQNDHQKLNSDFIGDDEGDDGEDDTELILQKEFALLIEQERKHQELKMQQRQLDQQSTSSISDQQHVLQEQIYQQQLLLQQQQQLAALQPGDFRIEIEKRFISSDCNRNFKFARKADRQNRKRYSQDSEDQSSEDSSLQSVDGITVYNLHAQNMKNYQREYMQMQEQTNDQMEKFKAQEQLRLQKEEEDNIEKERIQHQLRQQKMIQQQVYVQFQYDKYSQEKKNEQIQQLRDQLQKQQTSLLQMKANGNIPDSSQVIKTEAYDSDSVGRSTLTQYGNIQASQGSHIKNLIDQGKYQQNKFQQDDSTSGHQGSNANHINSSKKTEAHQQQQQLLQQGMKQCLSAEKQNSRQQLQLQKFKNVLMNKQQNQIQNKGQMNGNARRMKTEGNDIDSDINQYNNHHHHLHTQHRYQPDDIEEDETIENFEDALQDGSDNDSGEIARLDDIKINSYKQTASPPKNKKSSSTTHHHLVTKSQNFNLEGSNGKNFKNLMEILEKNEKNSKSSHSRQSTSISNSNQIGGSNMNTNGLQNNQYQKKNSSQHASIQTVQIQIQQAAAAAAAATINPSQITKNATYKSRPTTSQSNYYKNLYSSQNQSINIQSSSNRNTIQQGTTDQQHNSSKPRQSSKTSHSHYDGNSNNITIVGGVNGKKQSGINLNQSIEGFSSKQQSTNQSLQPQFHPSQANNSRKRSTSNKNNNSLSISSSIPNNNKLPMSSNYQKQPSQVNYQKQLENFKVDNLKGASVKGREEKAPSKAPTSQQHIMNLLNSGSFINNNTNNSFSVTKNMSINQGASNKVTSSSYQNAAKLKGRNANSFHQNGQSSNISSIHTSQTTNFNNKSTIVSNYSINSNSKKKLLSSSSSTNLINTNTSTIKNDSKNKQYLPNNQISTIINANININNLNPTNFSKVRISTNSNVRDSIQSQKGQGSNSRVQTEPSNHDEDYDLNYLQTRLSTLTKIPSKQSLLNNKSTARRKDNSGSKTNLREQLYQQQQQPNLVFQKQQQQQQQQIGQNQALQNLLINNQYNNSNIQMKTEESHLNHGQQYHENQMKYTENLMVKAHLNQQQQIHSNLRSTNEQSTSDLSDQNKLNGQSFDQIQKIRDYLKQKSSKYPIKQSQQMTTNPHIPGQVNGGSSQFNQQQGNYKEHYTNNGIHPVQGMNVGYQQSQQQQQQQHYVQNMNQKQDNQLLNQYSSQFNSNTIGQASHHNNNNTNMNNNQNYFQKQIR